MSISLKLRAGEEETFPDFIARRTETDS
jgi:hypothetical protein